MGPGKQRDLLVAIVALAVVLRLLHLIAISSDLLFQVPVIDEQTNVADARYLVEHSWLGPKVPFWKPPLYPYLLAVLDLVAGAGPWLPRLLNIGLDALSCLLVFAIGERVWSRRVGLIGAAIVATSGTMIYFCGELVSASLAVTLSLATLAAALRASAAPTPARWLGVGVLVGATALVRPEALLFAGVLAVFASRGERRLTSLAGLALGLVLMIAPVTIRNATRGGDLVLISSNGGINFDIGSNPAYRGMIGVRPGPEWERLVREPERVGLREGSSAASRFHVRQALARIAADPGGAIVHAGRKAVLSVHGHELASNFELYQVRRASPVLAVTLWHLAGLYFPFGLLLPLAVLGIAATYRRPGTVLLIAHLAVVAGVMVVFFVTARFRAPAVPVLALFAAAGGEWLVEVAKQRAWRGAMVRLVAAAGALVVANAPLFAEDRAVYALEMEAERHHYRGTVLFAEYQRYEEAVLELRAAAALQPDRVSTHFNLGQTFEAMRRPVETFDAMAEAVRAIDRSPGERYFEADALAAMDRALQRAPALRDTARGRGHACLRRRDFACAADAFREVGDDAFLRRALDGVSRNAAGAR